MKRVEITYGGVMYSVPDTDAATICEQVDEALRAEDHLWLTVNYGEGLPRETRILVTRGISFAITNAAE